MNALPIFNDDYVSIRFVKPPPGCCVIGKRIDIYYYIYTHNENYLLLMKNGKYGEYVSRNKEYNTVEEFLDEKQLRCVSVETMEVSVEGTHGHPDTNYFVTIHTPDDKWMLVSIDDDDDGDNITLYRAAGNTDSEWVPAFPHLVFTDVKKILKFTDRLDTLQMLSR